MYGKMIRGVIPQALLPVGVRRAGVGGVITRTSSQRIAGNTLILIPVMTLVAVLGKLMNGAMKAAKSIGAIVVGIIIILRAVQQLRGVLGLPTAGAVGVGILLINAGALQLKLLVTLLLAASASGLRKVGGILASRSVITMIYHKANARQFPDVLGEKQAIARSSKQHHAGHLM